MMNMSTERERERRRKRECVYVRERVRERERESERERERERERGRASELTETGLQQHCTHYIKCIGWWLANFTTNTITVATHYITDTNKNDLIRTLIQLIGDKSLWNDVEYV